MLEERFVPPTSDGWGVHRVKCAAHSHTHIFVSLLYFPNSSTFKTVGSEKPGLESVTSSSNTVPELHSLRGEETHICLKRSSMIGCEVEEQGADFDGATLGCSPKMIIEQEHEGSSWCCL